MKIKTHAKLIEINAAGASNVPGQVLLLPAGNLTTIDDVDYLVDDQSMQAIMSAHARRQVDLVIDYEHQTHLSEGAAPAGGWVQELHARADGIWGDVTWTDKAKTYLEDREYRYLSPAILVNKETRRVEEITDLGLTNSPRINAYPPVVNKGGARGDAMEFLNKLIKLLGLDAGTDEGKVIQVVESSLNSLKELRGKIQELSGAGESADDAATLDKLEAALNKATVHGPDLALQLNGIAKALGLNESAAEGEVLGAIKGLQEGKSQYSEIAQELNTIKKERAEEKAEQAVNAALNSGKIAPTQKEWAAEYAGRDPAGFAAYLNAAPQVVPMKDLPKGPEAPASGPPDEVQLEVNKALGISPELFAKHNQPEKEA